MQMFLEITPLVSFISFFFFFKGSAPPRFLLSPPPRPSPDLGGGGDSPGPRGPGRRPTAYRPRPTAAGSQRGWRSHSRSGSGRRSHRDSGLRAAPPSATDR